MASSAPRPGYPGHPQGPPDSLAAGIQNLYVTRPNAPVTRPPSFAGAGSSPMPVPLTGAPLNAPPPRGVSTPPPFVTGNMGPGRPMGVAQPPPPTGSRPGLFSASPPSSGPTVTSNGPAAFVSPGSRFPPTVQGPPVRQPGLVRGPLLPPGIRPMADSQNVPGIPPQVQQPRAPFLGGSQGVPGQMMQPQAMPFVGASHASGAPPMQSSPAPFVGAGQSGSPTMRPPAPPFSGATQIVPPSMQAPPAPFMGSSQSMPPPMQQPPPPFLGGSQVMPPPRPPTSSPYGSQPWPTQLAQTSQVPVLGGSMQTPQMYSTGAPLPPNQPVPLGPPGMGHPPGTGLLGMTRTGSPVGASPMAGASKIDPTQMPRPIPASSMITFETRQNNQANLPPPATSDYVARDTGNCSPRYMRCTMNQIPCTSDLLSTSSMPLALLVQPLAFPHPLEEPIQVVDFGEGGPIRCSRCKGYINPFMKFIDNGKHFMCNLCGFTDETPHDYYCNLGPDGRRRDADERPELCRGTVEFVATKEYMVRDPMPAVFFFLVDVSMNAIQSGATAAACSAVAQSINDLPESPQTMVGFATYDSTVQFYNLKRHLQQPLMLIVPDVQDVYTPLETDLIVQLAECRQHLEQLLDNIPTMFQNNKVPESAFGAAVKGAFLAMKSTGGKLLVFHSVLPSVGIGSLSAREVEGRANVSAGEKEAHKLLQPADKTLKTMAIEFAEYQVCVDLFATTQSYVDIASLSVIPRTTGGQVYYYYPFSAVSDSAKLYNDLRWNITRPQGFEAVMRVRCSQGLQVQEYFGNFCKRIPTDVDLPAIDCDKTIMVTFKHDDKFQDGAECAFQCALLYTTVYGQRRIRVTTLSLPCTSVLSNLFRAADLDAQFTCFLKQAGNDIPTTTLVQVRDQITNLCINILSSYRKFCATVSSSGQLILPEALKLLPLYTLALVKSVGLRIDGRIDERSYWISRVASLSASFAVPLVYPRMLPIHTLTSKAVMDQETNDSLMPSSLPLSSEHITDDGIFLLENGEDCLVYIGNSVNPDILQQLFGVSSVESISSQFVLQQFDNELSRKLNDVVNYIRRQRSSYLRFSLCRKGEPSGLLFFSYMVEDKTAAGLSYVEFLVHIHRQIQTKMS